jgi:hypothetical protein
MNRLPRPGKFVITQAQVASLSAGPEDQVTQRPEHILRRHHQDSERYERKYRRDQYRGDVPQLHGHRAHLPGILVEHAEVGQP